MNPTLKQHSPTDHLVSKSGKAKLRKTNQNCLSRKYSKMNELVKKVTESVDLGKINISQWNTGLHLTLDKCSGLLWLLCIKHLWLVLLTCREFNCYRKYRAAKSQIFSFFFRLFYCLKTMTQPWDYVACVFCFLSLFWALVPLCWCPFVYWLLCHCKQLLDVEFLSPVVCNLTSQFDGRCYIDALWIYSFLERAMLCTQQESSENYFNCWCISWKIQGVWFI